MRIYISGKITGESNYKELFDEAEKLLEEQGHEVINPAKLDQIYPGFEWEDYMQIDMALLRICDAVYMLKNWIHSKGATIEHEYAQQIKRKIFYEAD